MLPTPHAAAPSCARLWSRISSHCGAFWPDPRASCSGFPSLTAPQPLQCQRYSASWRRANSLGSPHCPTCIAPAGLASSASPTVLGRPLQRKCDAISKEALAVRRRLVLHFGEAGSLDLHLQRPGDRALTRVQPIDDSFLRAPAHASAPMLNELEPLPAFDDDAMVDFFVQGHIGCLLTGGGVDGPGSVRACVRVCVCHHRSMVML